MDPHEPGVETDQLPGGGKGGAICLLPAAHLRARLRRRGGPLLAVSWQNAAGGLDAVDGAPRRYGDALEAYLGRRRGGRGRVCALGGFGSAARETWVGRFLSEDEALGRQLESPDRLWSGLIARLVLHRGAPAGLHLGGAAHGRGFLSVLLLSLPRAGGLPKCSPGRLAAGSLSGYLDRIWVRAS